MDTSKVTKVQIWKVLLQANWDQQFLQFIAFVFPLDFSRKSSLTHEYGNHKSQDSTRLFTIIDTHIEQEKKFKTVQSSLIPILSKASISPLF